MEILGSRQKIMLDEYKRKFDEEGLIVLENLFSDEELDQHLRSVHEIRRRVDVKDENGFGDRIGQLHQLVPSLMNLAMTNKVLPEILRHALKDEPLLFGSLNFEKGSQQRLHVDAIFFWPEPEYSMAGVWVALEDVDLQNGPLIYVPGSHRWPMIRSEDIVADKPDVKSKRDLARAGKISGAELGSFVAEMGNLWTERYYRWLEEKRIEPTKLVLKKGTAVVWHSLLAHGGDIIADNTRSRNSVVYHFVGRNSSLFSFESFMLLDRTEFKKGKAEQLVIDRYKGIDYIKYPYFVTYNNGAQIVHNI